MRIKIYSLANCKGCIDHHATVERFCTEVGIPFEIVDLDLEQHVQDIIKYRLRCIPSTVFFDVDDKVLANKGGILSVYDLRSMHVEATLNLK